VASPQDVARDFGIPDDLVRHIDPASKLPIRMMGATGMLPVPPRVLLSILYVLLGDPDPKVSGAAKVSLLGLPEDLISKNLDIDTHPRVLEFMAFHREEESILENVVLRRQTNDETICYLAETAPPNILEIIAGNQERTLVTPEILLHLQANPACPVNLIEKVSSWQRMNRVELQTEALVEEPAEPPPAQPVEPELQEAPAQGAPQQEVPAQEVDAPEPLPDEEPAQPPPVAPWEGAEDLFDEFAHAESEASPPPVLQVDDPFFALMEDFGIELKPEYFDQGTGVNEVELQEKAEREARMAGRDHLEAEDVDVDGAQTPDLLTPMSDNQFSFSLDRGAEDDWDLDMLMDHGEEADDDLKTSLAKRVSKMTVGQKIKLSYLGNKEVREILIRDTNKMVCSAVVKSGRLTDPEVIKSAGNRAISEEVLRLIGQNREWVRKYPVKVALCNNPKTPVGVAMRFLSSLLPKDLRNLAFNRNVSSVLSNAANGRLRQRGRA